MSEFRSMYEGMISAESYRSFYVKTYLRMALGLVVTAAVAFFGFVNLVNGGFIWNLIGGWGSMVLLLAQLGIAIFFSARLTHMSKTTAIVCFYLYSALTGVTLSVLPLVFDIATIFMALSFCAILFVNLCVIGMTTKIDISRFSGIMVAGLMTLAIVGVVSIFVHNALFNNIYNYLVVILFVFITAWDAQNLKRFYVASTADTRMITNFSTYAAFGLYLDFINLFLRILAIFGNHNDN